MPVQVIFTYDEESRLLEPIVKGCTETLEAKQAFNAAVLTCQALDPAKMESKSYQLSN